MILPPTATAVLPRKEPEHAQVMLVTASIFMGYASLVTLQHRVSHGLTEQCVVDEPSRAQSAHKPDIGCRRALSCVRFCHVLCRRLPLGCR